jgi:hypothetical protein
LIILMEFLHFFFFFWSLGDIFQAISKSVLILVAFLYVG